ncbi:MAG: O-antigen ligase family protein [Candidatus Omnitrophica bacterium]|nr:O-antigen ligase family protein [Candidatus Omnitrophota bacterium]
MRFQFPLMNQEPEKDLARVLLLTPLWWALGFNFFIYHTVVFFLALRLMLISSRSGTLRVPFPLFPLFLFLLGYILSILINIPYRPSQRIFASLNNLSQAFLGAVLMLAVFQMKGEVLLSELLSACRLLTVFTFLLAVISLLLWFAGFDNLWIEPLLLRVFPSLMEYPYFYSLMIMKITMTEWVMSEMPRLSLYAGAPTATGGLMVMILPLTIASYRLKQSGKIQGFLGLLMLHFPLLFSQARSAICGWLAALMLVAFVSRQKKIIWGLALLWGGFFLSDFLYRSLEWVVNLRQSSNVGRLRLYEEAWQIVKGENPVFGLGVRLRDEFTVMALGTHAFYMELIFVTGFFGLACFVIFQLAMAIEWFRQQKWLVTSPEEILWQCLGLGYWASNLWLMTDSIIAYPHIAYIYFLMSGLILLQGRILREGRHLIWKNHRLCYEGALR